MLAGTDTAALAFCMTVSKAGRTIFLQSVLPVFYVFLSVSKANPERRINLLC